jgi:hypothetical protein
VVTAFFYGGNVIEPDDIDALDAQQLRKRLEELEAAHVHLRAKTANIMAQMYNTINRLEQWQRWQATIEPPKLTELKELRRLLVKHFSENEFRDLCFETGVDYHAVPGERLADKARELILYLQRRNGLTRLLNYCRNHRPMVSWPDL